MTEKFGKIFRHLYKREYETENGISIKYYARFISKNEGRVSFALGDDLESAKDTLKEIEVADTKGLSLAQWRGRKSKAPIDTKPQANDGSIDRPFTFSEWANLYPLQPSAKYKRNGKPKRSLQSTEVPIIKNHLEPFFGTKRLTTIGREDLVRYREKALTSKAFRQGKESKISIIDGTVANHLSLLHRMLKVAEIEGFAVKIPVFDYLINRCENAGRALTVEERQKALALMPKWLARAFEFATETCLDEGDLIRLTDDMVDRKTREVVPQGGRIKTGVEQRSYLTDRALAILDDIRAEKKAGRIVPNAEGLIFTLDNGQRFDSRKVHDAIQKARGEIGYFRFKDARHTAKTDWLENGINPDASKLGAGQLTDKMHRRYQHARPGTVAAEFQRRQRENDNKNVNKTATGTDGEVVTS